MVSQSPELCFAAAAEHPLGTKYKYLKPETIAATVLRAQSLSSAKAVASP